MGRCTEDFPEDAPEALSPGVPLPVSLGKIDTFRSAVVAMVCIDALGDLAEVLRCSKPEQTGHIRRIVESNHHSCTVLESGV